MNQTFFLQNCKPSFFVLDAKDKILGRLAAAASSLLIGKTISLYTKGNDYSNFVFIINAARVNISGNKPSSKLYFNPTRRPGSLKQYSFQQLLTTAPGKIIEKAIAGMLPKGALGRKAYKRLFVFNNNKIHLHAIDTIKKYPWVLIT